jgi:hypothetical protein
MRKILVAFAWFLLAALTVSAAERPRIRAITGFVKLDRAHYQAQIRQAVEQLQRVSKAFTAAGYQVQGIRIATQPFPEYLAGATDAEVQQFFADYEALATKLNFLPALGPAMVRDSDDPRFVTLLTNALRHTKLLHGSIVIAAADGIHWKGVRAAARLIKNLSETSPNGYGNFNFAAVAMLPPYGPFFPGAYNQAEEHAFSVAVEMASVVTDALRGARGDPTAAERRLTAVFKDNGAAIEAIAKKAAAATGWRYLGVDLSTAPLREISIGRAVEEFTGAPFGSSGTLSAAAMITRAIKSAPVQHIGYSGMMVPILEDAGLAQRWGEGHITIDGVLAYSAVCGTGLDTIPLPGDISEEQLARIIGDVAALAFKWQKPLTARLMPIKGKKAGDMTAFDDPFLVNTRLQPLP